MNMKIDKLNISLSKLPRTEEKKNSYGFCGKGCKWIDVNKHNKEQRSI